MPTRNTPENTKSPNRFINFTFKKRLFTILAVFGSYLFIDQVSRILFYSPPTASSVILTPGGIALAAIVLCGYTVWSVIALTYLVRDLNQTLGKLEEEENKRNEFIATLAHELRNPLSPMLNYVEIIKLQDKNNPEIKEAVNAMGSQIKTMSRIVEDLMDVARIEQGKITLQQELVDVRIIINRAVDSVKAFIEERNHEFNIEITSKPIWINADPLRIQQIIVNLLFNAAKYTEPGGHIYLKCHTDNGNISIRIKDTGIGISAESLPLIFDMFSQVDRSITRKRGGLGIGLRLVRSLIELQGGTVRAESEGLGKGSEFIITMPARRETDRPLNGRAKTGNQKEGSATPAKTTSREILIVDDNQEATKSLAKLLRYLGHKTSIAFDGLSAIEKVRTHLPEVVLLDIGMPGMSGYEIAKKLRANLHFQGTIVAISGYGQDKDKKLSHEAGFDYHLVKPVKIDDLKKILLDEPDNSNH